MNYTNTSDMTDKGIASIVSIASIITILYVAGLYLNLRIIRVSKTTKDMTWKLDITHSMICIALYTYNVLIHPTTYFVENLYMYTGEWFCYAAKVISQFLLFYLGAHSTIIAAMKYVIIVYEEKIRLFKSKVKDTFFILNISYPIFLILFTLFLIPNYFALYGGHTHINRCFGSQGRNYTKWYFMCDLIETHHASSSFDETINIVKVIICKAQVIIFYATTLNFFDLLLYCRTFAFMRKKILPNGNNLANKHLSDNANKINEMKLMVNLQITATLTIFEFLYGLLYMIVFGYVSRGSSFATLIQGMALYFVLLPFSFLMNTTDNKYRIVEMGWRNVFKNIILGWKTHIAKLFSVLQSNDRISSVDPMPASDNSSNEQVQTSGTLAIANSLEDGLPREPKDKKTRRKSSVRERKPQSLHDSNISLVDNRGRFSEVNGIFIISNNTESMGSNITYNDGAYLNVPIDTDPSTSGGEKCHSTQSIDSDEEDSISSKSDETDTKSQNTYREIVQNIIQIMKDSLEHEILYLHYFKAMIDITESISMNTEMKIPIFDQFFGDSEAENVRKRNDNTTKMKGHKSDRNALRIDVLDKLELCFQSNQTKQDAELLLIELIDLEESFIDE